MIPHVILAASLVAAPTQSIAATPGTDGLAELRAIERADDLGALRAGAPAFVAPIEDQEREELRAAANASADLAELRAGMTDRDWMIVGVVLLGVLLIVIIA